MRFDTRAMNRLTSAVRVYREDGLSTLLDKTGEYLLRDGSVAPSLRSVLGEELHLKLYSYQKLGYWPHVREPRTYNEKILHRKLHTDDERFPVMEDKYRVRDYVETKVGDEILPELYHVTDDPATIPFDALPEEYVVKPTHSSGAVLLVDGDREVDRRSVEAECERWLNTTHGQLVGEYWYDQIPPRIVVEEYLSDVDSGPAPDFKFHVFHGRVEYVHVDLGRFSDLRRRFFDRNWNPQEFTTDAPLGPVVEEPESLDRMIAIAEALGGGFDYIRVDLYQPNENEVVFGELTVAPGSGVTPFDPRRYDFELGSLW